ncbi:hypothetical protein GOBAR_AA38471 [Gossypium barbadense]|nr:hypothetical protein GOBAR_AA38471 [Gossypium barbadense]
MESKANKQMNGGMDEDSGRKGEWHVPILAMTADVIHATYDALNAGWMDVSKPFEEAKLYQVVAEFFKSTRSNCFT